MRHLDLYHKDFLDSHPELVPNKKSDSPDEDKSIHDARLLIPTLQDFFHAHPLIIPKTFLGDAAFDSVGLYKSLLTGIPCCPNDASLPMKPEGKSKLRSGVERYKFVCPKMTFDKCDDGKYRRFCSAPIHKKYETAYRIGLTNLIILITFI